MSSTEAPKEPVKAAATEFENVTPILRVGKIAASIDYYVSGLGFKLDWQQGLFASISRDRCHIFLCEGDQGNPGSWVWIGIGDLEALFEESKSRGAKVPYPPTNYSWTCEMQSEDLDGNVLPLGSDRKPGFAVGEWLDMHGDLWTMRKGRAIHLFHLPFLHFPSRRNFGDWPLQ